MKNVQKAKLSIDEQIKHMKESRGITFNITSEEQVATFLANNNYYFKIKSYAKNYDKYIKESSRGKYINLDFAYLQELSTIDMHLRKFIIKITLDIEHFLKTQLLRDFEKNTKEDGYTIIKAFYERYPTIMDNIYRNIDTSYCCDLVNKYKSCFAIWNIVEVLSFGDFIKLYDLYYEKYYSKDNMKHHLWSVKFLRNAAAHNNCLINSLKRPYSIDIQLNKEVNTFISKIPDIPPADSRVKKMSNPAVHDFVVTLFVFYRVVGSSSTKKHTFAELKELVDVRMIRNKEYFEKNQLIISYYKFIKIIVDYFYDICI